MAKAILAEHAGFESSSATLAIGASSFDGYDINGGLTQFRRGGTQVSAEFYADKGVIGIGRWSGGAGLGGFDRGSTQGDHYVFGLRATSLPTAGLFTYELGAYTQPTIRNVATTVPGSVSGRAAVRYVGAAAAQVGLDVTVNVNGSSYAVRSPGGITSPSLGFVGGNGGVVFTGQPFTIQTGTGPACTGSICYVDYAGFLAGTAGSNLGLVYSIYSNGSSTTNTVDGALLFNNPNRPTQTQSGTYTQTFTPATVGAAALLAPAASFGLARLPDGRDMKSESLGSNPPTTFSSFAGNTGGADFTVSRGSASATEGNGAYGRIGWVRWNSGNVTIGGVSSTLTGGQGIHMIWGTALTGTAPTGRANYNLIGGTLPTTEIGSTGTFAGALAVDFATSRVGWDSLITMGGDKLNFYSAGGTTTPSVTLAALTDGRRSFTGSGTVAAQSLACGGCSGSASGFISGVDASEAGFSYSLNTYLGTVNGVAGFRRENGTQWTAGAPTDGPVNVVSTGIRTILQGEATTIAAGNDGAASAFNGTAAASRSSARNFDNGGLGGVIGWTRWSEGNVSHDGTLSYGPNVGVHVIWGTPVTNMPTTGTASYSLAAATQATFHPSTGGGSIAPGTFTGTVGVDFAGAKVGWSTNVNVGGTAYTFNSTGGSAAPSVALTAGGTFGASGTVTSTVGTSFGSGYGFLAGPGGSHLGFGYRIYPSSSSNNIISGVAAFTKN